MSSNNPDLIKAQIAKLNAETALLERKLFHEQQVDKERFYRFADAIVSETVDTVNEIIRHWLQLNNEPITIAFNSPGGSIFAGLDLYDFISEQVTNGATIHITGYGHVASMASVVMQAGSTRSLRPNAHFMVHEVSSLINGPLGQMKNQMEFVESLQERCEAILASRADISQAEIHDKSKNRDWWLTPEQALEYQFIDHIATVRSY
jgi:ATP-dependent Clp protease, protease subunit